TTSSARYVVSPTSGTVQPGGSLDVTVTFSPTATGDVNASLSIVSNAPDSPHSVTLHGSGEAAPPPPPPSTPQLEFSAASLSFGTVEVGSNAQKTVQIGNTGDATLNVTNIPMSNAAYTVTPKTGSVNAGAAMTVTVTF